MFQNSGTKFILNFCPCFFYTFKCFTRQIVCSQSTSALSLLIESSIKHLFSDHNKFPGFPFSILSRRPPVPWQLIRKGSRSTANPFRTHPSLGLSFNQCWRHGERDMFFFLQNERRQSGVVISLDFPLKGPRFQFL